jgi:hypothetical protein
LDTVDAADEGRSIGGAAAFVGAEGVQNLAETLGAASEAGNTRIY